MAISIKKITEHIGAEIGCDCRLDQLSESDFEDVVKAAKKNPGKVSISTSGTGGLWHELALLVSDAAGIKLKFVPYKG